MLLLAVFVTVNAAFFPGGDVLMLFVIVGLVLFFARNWSDNMLLVAAAVCLLQPVEWGHYIAGIVNGNHQLPDLRVGALYAEVAEAVKSGSLMDFLFTNISTGQVASFFWAVNAGRCVQTAGLFLLGFYLGRARMFVPTEANLRVWVKVLVVSAIAFGPLYVLRESIMAGGRHAYSANRWHRLRYVAEVCIRACACVGIRSHVSKQKIL